MNILLVSSIIVTLALTGVLSRIFIPKLKSLKMGQPISDIGPRWHKSKEGTPTMGGLFFIVPILFVLVLSSLIMADELDLPRLWITAVSSLLFGLIGIVDDAAKLRKKENVGLLAWQKFLLQLIVASAYVGIMAAKGYLSTVVVIPFFRAEVDFGFFFYIISVVLICGIVNSVNLTDGIDGLASSVTAVVAAVLAVMSVMHGNDTSALFSCAVFGGCLGFLIYNAYPAKIFMGDTGSLFLGGAVVGIAFIYGSPLLILVLGIVYVFETISVILQVSYYKLSHGKRLFKMAPFHHHLEKCGFSENKIVFIAIGVTFVFSLIAVLLG